MKILKTVGFTFVFALLLLSSASCFKVVTGGNVDKGWPRNHSKNSRHSTTTDKVDTIRVNKE